MNRKHVLAASVAMTLFVGGFTVWELLRGDPSPAFKGSKDHTESPSLSSRDDTSTGSSSHTRPLWTVGREYKYKMGFSAAANLADKEILDLNIDCNLSLAAIDEDEQSILMRGQLGDLSLRLGDSTAARRRELEASFVEPFYFTAGFDSRVTLIRIPEGLSIAAEGILKSLPSSIQFSFPKWPPPQTWSSEEVDPTGRYAADYATASPGLFVKHKVQYVEVLGATSTGMQMRISKPEVVNSRATYRFSEGILRELSLDEEMRVPSDILPVMSSRTRLSLAYVAELDVVAKLAEWREAAGKLRDQSPYETAQSTHARRPEIEEARIAGRDFRGMMASLVNAKLAEGKEKQDTERHRAFVGLSALLRTSGQAAREATQYVRKRGAEKTIVIDALGSSGSPESQAALVGLLKDRSLNDARDRERAIRALAMTKEPSGASVAFVAGLVNDPELSGHAKMTLGSLVHNVESTDPSAAKLGTDRLLAKLQEDDGTKAMNTDLRALGNAGSSDALPAITLLLNHDSPEIRASAVQALRRISGPEADGLIAWKLLTDVDRGVRHAAANAMRDRLPTQTLVDAATTSVRLDTDVNTRVETLRTLGIWPGSLPVVIDAIRWVAFNDASEKLRAIAESYLIRLAHG